VTHNFAASAALYQASANLFHFADSFLRTVVFVMPSTP
jgi:hypothetical protein